MTNQRSIKIKNMKIKNFCNITDLQIVFKDNVTKLIGLNGSGKTTILDSIWVAFRGIAQKDVGGNLIGQRFRFIGKKGRSADIEITLIDEKTNKEFKITRHITKDTSILRFNSPKDYRISETWLKELLNVSLLSASHFIQLSPKQQALELGIDTSKFDGALFKLKDDAKLIRLTIKEIGEPQKIEKVESVNISKLIQEREKISRFNTEQRNREREIEKSKNDLENFKTRKNELEDELKKLKEKLLNIDNRILECGKYIGNLPAPEKEKSHTEIMEQIDNAESINEKANEYKIYLERIEKKEKVQLKLNENLNQQKTIQEKRLEYIKSFDFGLNDLSINESGELELKKKLIRDHQFSKGELELIVAMFAASLNPELKVRIVDDIEHLDPQNQKKLINSLVSRGFQVIAAEVKQNKENANEILLKECEIVPDKRKQVFERWGGQDG